jgi:dTDP-4-amino-4,6-dideoxygalactose transaminase
MINVTKSHLPPIEEYVAHLRGIWQRGHLTNNGPLLVDLERQLAAYLGVKHCFVLTNGMLGLHIALRALEVKGSVVTTPFSYVATSAAIAWEGHRLVYADIDASLCITAASCLAVWPADAGAILATHVYGNACDVEGLAALAKSKKVPLIFDAAHAFGAKLNGKSLVSYGDVAMLSFHATKLFHTVEGGALICQDDAVAERISYLRNFGHASPESFHGYGTNAKMSEFHAAMGLCNLKVVDQLIAHRKASTELYDQELAAAGLSFPVWAEKLERNCAYYPCLFPSEASLLRAVQVLNTENIYPRRYFYPSLTTLNYAEPQAAPYCDDVAKRVLCLPLSAEIEPVQVKRICGLIRRSLTSSL